MVTEEGRPLTGENIFDFLQSQSVSSSQSGAGVSNSDVSKFCKKLDEVNIGVLTYGLAFHTKHTKLLRFPYCKEDFFEKVIATSAAGWEGTCWLEIKLYFFQSSNYILTRAERLNEAADRIRPENPEIATQLRYPQPFILLQVQHSLLQGYFYRPPGELAKLHRRGGIRGGFEDLGENIGFLRG